MHYAKVVVDLNAKALDRCFTYSVPENMDLVPGDMVRVPFGPQKLEGFVLETANEPEIDPSKIRSVLCKVGENSMILPELLRLAEFMREKYSCTMTDALRVMIPAQMRGEQVKARQIRFVSLTADMNRVSAACANAPLQRKAAELLAVRDYALAEIEDCLPGAAAACRAMSKKGLVRIGERRILRRPEMRDAGRSATDPKLTPQQKQVVNELINALDGGGRFLLYGVTGSGKTEVYIRLVREALARGRGAIILVPEIALTPQTVGWFHARFGDMSAVLHSRLSAGERFDEWQRIRSGEARVVIGARSAVFAPMENPGVIIVDEEHEGAYLSEKRPRYDAREIAAERMRMSGGVLVLGSATPSISSFMRTRPQIRPENRLTLLELSSRVLGRSLPSCSVVDMRRELEEGNKGIFSGELQTELKACMDAGKQAILFINRRGYSTFVSCRACGYVVKCSSCDVAMTFHQADASLKCHYCGSEIPQPTVCPACGSRFIKYFGAGTQKIEEEAQKLFPDKRILRMDMDTTSGKDGHAKLLEQFRTGQADILVGTQMIAKGLDFPNVTLVGIVAADTTLNLPDFRSAERTFQLITQVAGRAGRADTPGKVVIQTYTPDAYAISCAVKQDYRAFYGQEVNYRKRSLYPPYTTIARLVFSGKNEDQTEKAAAECAEKIKRDLQEKQLYRFVLSVNCGRTPIKRLRGEERFQVLIKMYTAGETAAIEGILEQISLEEIENVNVELEINPTSMV